MIRNRKPLEKKKAIALFIKGFNQKDIAIQLNITEKTVGTWLKEIKEKQNQNQEDIKLLNIRMKNLLQTPNSCTADVKNIADAISSLENIWFNELIKI